MAAAPVAAVRVTFVSNAALAAALESGSSEAAVELYDRYACLVDRTLVRVLGPDSDRDDPRQEVFIPALGSITSLREPDALEGWLRGIAVFIARRAIDKRARRRRWMSWWFSSDDPPELPDVGGETRDESRAQDLNNTFRSDDMGGRSAIDSFTVIYFWTPPEADDWVAAGADSLSFSTSRLGGYRAPHRHRRSHRGSFGLASLRRLAQRALRDGGLRRARRGARARGASARRSPSSGVVRRCRLSPTQPEPFCRSSCRQLPARACHIVVGKIGGGAMGRAGRGHSPPSIEIPGGLLELWHLRAWRQRYATKDTRLVTGMVTRRALGCFARESIRS